MQHRLMTQAPASVQCRTAPSSTAQDTPHSVSITRSSISIYNILPEISYCTTAVLMIALFRLKVRDFSADKEQQEKH